VNKRIKGDSAHVGMQMSESVEAKIRRGEKSWVYIYTLLGFALTIETGVMGLIKPLQWPWNLTTLIVVAAATIWLFLDCGWFQNKLIGIKVRNEDKLR
jgi:hypothetical protein